MKIGISLIKKVDHAFAFFLIKLKQEACIQQYTQNKLKTQTKIVLPYGYNPYLHILISMF